MPEQSCNSASYVEVSQLLSAASLLQPRHKITDVGLFFLLKESLIWCGRAINAFFFFKMLPYLPAAVTFCLFVLDIWFALHKNVMASVHAIWVAFCCMPESGL